MDKKLKPIPEFKDELYGIDLNAFDAALSVLSETVETKNLIVGETVGLPGLPPNEPFFLILNSDDFCPKSIIG